MKLFIMGSIVFVESTIIESILFFSLWMEFYKASYTSLKGSVTDFIVPVDQETTLIKNVVSSAFKQLRML